MHNRLMQSVTSDRKELHRVKYRSKWRIIHWHTKRLFINVIKMRAKSKNLNRIILFEFVVRSRSKYKCLSNWKTVLDIGLMKWWLLLHELKVFYSVENVIWLSKLSDGVLWYIMNTNNNFIKIYLNQSYMKKWNEKFNFFYITCNISFYVK